MAKIGGIGHVLGNVMGIVAPIFVMLFLKRLAEIFLIKYE